MRTDGWVFDSACYDRCVSYRRSAQDQVTGPSTGATTMRKRAPAESGIVFSKSGASYTATVVDDTNTKPKRRYFPVSEEGHAQAVAWMESRGLDEEGQPMTAKEPGAEEPVQHGGGAQPEHCNSPAEHSAWSADPRPAVSTGADSIGNTCSPHAAHAEDAAVVCGRDGADENADSPLLMEEIPTESGRGQVTGPSTGATTRRKRAPAESGIVWSGARYTATVVDDTNGKPKRRFFTVSEEGLANAVTWMESMGLAMTANEAANTEDTSTADAAGAQAPESGAEEPAQHGDAAQPEHRNSPVNYRGGASVRKECVELEDEMRGQLLTTAEKYADLPWEDALRFVGQHTQAISLAGLAASDLVSDYDAMGGNAIRSRRSAKDLHLLMPVNQFRLIVLRILEDAKINCEVTESSLRILQRIAEILMENHIESLYVQLASRSGKMMRMRDVETLQLYTIGRWDAEARRNFMEAGTQKLHSKDKSCSMMAPGSDLVKIKTVKAATGKVKCMKDVYCSLQIHWARIIGNVVKAAAKSSGTRQCLTVADAVAFLRSEAFAYAGYTNLAESHVSFTSSVQMMRGGSEAVLAVEDGRNGREQKENGEAKEQEELEAEKEVTDKAAENTSEEEK